LMEASYRGASNKLELTASTSIKTMAKRTTHLRFPSVRTRSFRETNSSPGLNGEAP
jgi:hypothetical protein